MDAVDVFTTPSEVGSFSQLRGVLQNPKLKNKRNAQDQLKTIPAFISHSTIKKTFPRRKYLIEGYQEHWQADLAFLDKYSRQNKGYKYILGVIDSLSKKVFARPLKKKTSAVVKEAFEDIVKEAGYTPKRIHFDRGTEFRGVFKEFLEQNNIKSYHSYSKIAPSIERWWRTLKQRIYTYFTYTGKKQWYNVLQDFVHSYNQTPHSVTKFAPNDVTKDDEAQILYNIYNKYLREPRKSPVYKLSDVVQIARTKLLFEKAGTATVGEEQFVVSEIVNTKPITYKLKDLSGEPIAGKYYAEELVLAHRRNK